MKAHTGMYSLTSLAARWWIFAAALALTTLYGSEAGAQGRCNCNSGCHMYPGQCVQSGSSGCESGYAPFCGTRTESCPRSGWVSCSGDCACVRIGPTDAGIPDVPGMDTPRADAPGSTDVVMSIDRPSAPDAPASDAMMSGPDTPTPPRDAPTPPGDSPVTPGDTPVVPGDSPVTPGDTPTPPGDTPTPPGDTPTPPGDALMVPGDATMTSMDASVPPGDGGCVCPAGVCIEGVCITERCMYQPELGFVCARAGTICRAFGNDAYCVPVCLGVRCETGNFCDDRSNGQCVRDMCATIQCPVGTTCRRNQCGRWDGPDGSLLTDAAGVDGGVNSVGRTAVDDGGCGCHTAGEHGRSGVAWWLAMAAVMVLRKRRNDAE